MGVFPSMDAGFGKIEGVSTMSGDTGPQDGGWRNSDSTPAGVGDPRPESGWTGGQVPVVLPLDLALMVPDLESRDRMGAIKELVDRMHLEGCVRDSLAFLQSVMDREDVESTVVGAGVAFPHARCRSVTRLAAALGISREGVEFPRNGDTQQVHIICLLGVPVIGSGGYLPLLGALTALFGDGTFRSGFLGCRTSEQMRAYLDSAASDGQEGRLGRVRGARR
jgi:mannitol/fructose-specific phosphotransferase system IIA component (Ntr-type)